MAMIYLKSCRKCGGDMYQVKDDYGAYRQCLQCGFVHDMVKKSPEALQADAQTPDLERKSV